MKHYNLMLCLGLLISLSTMLFQSCNDDDLSSSSEDEESDTEQTAIIYVYSDAQGEEDGSSWTNAYTDIQDALESAEAASEIWIAQGTYYPTTDTDQDISFQMIEDVDLYGGFNGSETAKSERDWETNVTILSGDIGTQNLSDDNSKHVVIAADNTILDGFTIQDGNSLSLQGPPLEEGTKAGEEENHTSPEAILSTEGENSGAGLLNYQASTTVRNTIFKNNSAIKGGAVYNMTKSSISQSDNSVPVFINVSFINNVSLARGGAISNDLGTNPVFVNCDFEDNICFSKGGAMYNDFGCNPVIVNTSFTGSEALRAAVLGNDGGSNSLLVNVSITENTAEDMGAALYQGSYAPGMSSSKNTSTVINSKIYNNYSVTHGMASFMNWGESWVYSYGSEIDEWSYDNDELGSEYSSLISAADACVSLSAEDIQDDYLDLFIENIIFIENEGNASWDIMTAATEVSIPDYVLYVNASATGSDNGSSWTNAYTDLQDAIDAAYSNGGAQLWVAEGTYTPGSSRDDSFELKNYVGIYGGFSGTETALDERDYLNNETILSGDIGTSGVAKDNVYHVVKGSQYALIDGITIQDGYADGSVTDGYGGGMQNLGYESSTIIKNTTFQNNYANEGGAIYNYFNSVSYLYNVTIKDNSAEIGGGIANRAGCNILIENSVLENNTAEYRAGAVLINYGSSVICNDVTFTSNSTEGNGGAIWVDDQASQYGGTLPVFTDCVFEGNSAVFYGGALHNFNKAETTFSNCSMSGNSAQYGADIANTETGILNLISTSGDIYTDETSSTL